MKTMMAAFVLSPREVVVETCVIPTLKEHEVLVRVKACGICASDLKFFNGLKSYQETTFGKNSPGFTGHEFAGEIVAIGSNVTSVREGDYVTPFIISSCGVCKYCSKGRENLCPKKRYVHGGFAEYVKVSERNLLKLPSTISIEDACLIEPLACCINGAEQLNLKPDDIVIIIGDGPMGLLNLQIVKTYGAECIVIGHHNNRLKLAEELGASLIVNSSETDAYQIVMKAVDGYGADSVILTVNNKNALENALQLLSRGGRLNIFAGAHPDYEINITPNKIHYHEITITGSADGLRKHYNKAIELIKSETIKPSIIVSHRYPLPMIKEALNIVEKRTAVKVLVKP